MTLDDRLTAGKRFKAAYENQGRLAYLIAETVATDECWPDEDRLAEYRAARDECEQARIAYQNAGTAERLLTSDNQYVLPDMMPPANTQFRLELAQ